MRFLMLWLLAVGFLFASTTVAFQKGWQLVGVPAALENMSDFDNKAVEIVWGYDASTQSWQGFSPDVNMSTKLIDKSIAPLTSLKPWQAIWVYSNEAWSLTLADESQPQEAQNAKIELYKGWNLIAIPQQSVVSEGFFGDAVVWKYSASNAWSVNVEDVAFPSIDAIGTSEGLWVKSESTRTIDVDQELSKLHTFDNETAMQEYIRKMLNIYRNYYYYMPMIEPGIVYDLAGVPEFESTSVNANVGADTSTSTDGAENATQTNLQEEGVDEADILKHDGTHIFSVDNANNRILVTTFLAIAQQDYTPKQSIDMQGHEIVSMFLQENRLVVISNYRNYTIYAEAKSDESIAAESMIAPNYDTQSFYLDIFDVSDINNIQNIASHRIEGYYQDSRLIDGKLFLISQFYPQINYEYPKVYVQTDCNGSEIYYTTTDQNQTASASSASYAADESDEVLLPNNSMNTKIAHQCYMYNYDENGSAWEYDYVNPIVKSEKLTPNIITGSTTTALVTPQKFYAPYKLDQQASITSISRFDINNGANSENISFLGNTHTYYASLTSLYLVSSEYPFYYNYSHYKEQQMVYKFSLGTPIAYEGRGFVPGHLLNQFSMSEKDDYLRVATTEGQSWWNQGTNNSVYTLKEHNATLQIHGTLSGLGHKSESIRAVRFMGDRGYVVTFEQTDPLYTLDLSDPEAPKSVGELQIPGFSEYLHVVDENRVISVGRDADENGRSQGLQLQLFDVSDFANPQLADKVQIGDSVTYSEAEYNHKAFAYRSSDMTLGIPYRNYNAQDHGYSEHFGIYRVNGMQIDALHTLVSADSSWSDMGRGVIFDLDAQMYGALFKGENIMCESIE